MLKDVKREVERSINPKLTAGQDMLELSLHLLAAKLLGAGLEAMHAPFK